MALKAGYVGVKRWLYEKLQATTTKNVQDIADIWADNTKTGVHNFLLPLTGSYDNNGITITPESNNVGIKINGTSTAEINYDYIPEGSILANLRGKFKLSLGVDSIAGMNVVFYKSTSGSWNLSGTVKEIEVNLTDAEHLNGKVRIYIANAKTYSNVVINPMITALEDPDTMPAPFAMTNRQLTTDKVSKTLASTDTKATIFSESSKVSTCTAILNDLLVSLRLTSTSGAATSGAWTTIATLNEAYRPAGLVYEAAIDDAGNPFGWVRIHSDTGKVEVYHGAGSAKTVNISTLYLRNTSAAANRSLDREVSPEVIADDPEPVTKTTRSTKKTATTKEGE